MTTDRKLKIVLVAAAIIFFGVTFDTDYCRFTAASVSRLRVWGIPIPSTTVHYEGFGPWLSKTTGTEWPREYVDYLNYHPLFFVSSTAPGNWMFLDSARHLYDQYPEARAEVRHVLISLSNRKVPSANGDDFDALNRIAERCYRWSKPAR